MRRIAFAMFLIVAVLAGCAPVTGTPVPAPATLPGARAAVAEASPVPSGTNKPLSKVTLAMGYIPSVQFAPFYVAQEKGYFRDAGLDVTFQYGAESDLVKLVGSNQVPFMIGSGDQVVLGRSQGLPVRYVMRWYRRFPVVLFAKESAGVHSPGDLAGKKVGISMLSGASYVAWKALTYATGLDPSKVNLQVVGFTQAAAVEQDRVDAALDYSVNGPVQMGLAGTPITVIPVANFMDLPSNGIITNDQMIKNHPDVVRALVQATVRGLQDTLANPDAAFAASLRAVPEAGGDQAKVSRAIFDESLKLWQAEPGTLGVSDPKMWEQAASFMKQTGLIDQAVAPGDLYTNQFMTSQ
jgi:NitT/TauT family transport system substrate-binding protein